MAGKRILKAVPTEVPKRPVRKTAAKAPLRPKPVTASDSNVELETAITNYVQLRTKIEDAESAKKDLGKDILHMLEDRGIDTYKGQAGQATSVYPVSAPVVDPDRLRKRIGAAMWAKITTKILDHNKLEAFIKSGEISQQDVAASSSDPVEGTPHVRVTAR